MSETDYYGTKSNEYVRSALNVRHNSIKSFLYRKYCGKRHLDIAAGRGGDIHKIAGTKCTDLWMSDVDADAINELVRRWMMLVKQKKWVQLPTLTPIVVPADYYSTAGRGYTDPVPSSLDSIFVMFAVHYLCPAASEMKAFLSYVASKLAVGGHFCVTLLDGKRTREALPIAGDGYELKENDERGVSVTMPSIGKAHNEPLIDIDAFVAAAEAAGLVLQERANFDDFRVVNGGIETLAAIERTISALNVALVFRLG